jgi:hypothetical protein
MPEPMADVAISLVAAVLFAWFACAFAQFAMHGASWKRGATTRAKPSCVRKDAPPRRAARTISVALTAIAMPGLLAALFVHHAVAVAAAESGVLVGCWLAAHRDFIRWKRAIAAVGCALALAAMCASVAGMLVLPLHAVTLRIALYISAMLGALAFGAAATVFRFARDTRTISRHPLAPSRGEHALYLAAFALIVTLGAGIALSPASKEFDVSALGAACMLAAALGVCLMGGARYTRRAANVRVTRATPDTSKPSALSRWSVVPDAWLVAACGPAAYEPTNFDDWLAVYQPPAAQTGPTIHRASRDCARRRRRSTRRIAADH